MNYDPNGGEFLTPGLTSHSPRREPNAGRLGHMQVLLGAVFGAPLCLILLVVLSSAWGGSTPHTVLDVQRCMADHGATALTPSFDGQQDTEGGAIANFISGYKGTVSGMFHGYGFHADIYDDVYLTQVAEVDVFDRSYVSEPGGSQADFEPLDACFDTFGPYTFNP
jgi:hypothetical protein